MAGCRRRPPLGQPARNSFYYENNAILTRAAAPLIAGRLSLGSPPIAVLERAEFFEIGFKMQKFSAREKGELCEKKEKKCYGRRVQLFGRLYLDR